MASVRCALARHGNWATTEGEASRQLLPRLKKREEEPLLLLKREHRSEGRPLKLPERKLPSSRRTLGKVGKTGSNPVKKLLRRSLRQRKEIEMRKEKTKCYESMMIATSQR